MKKERLRDARRLALVCAGATVMALNIKSFVRVGGLYPGGFNGLTLLLQAIFSRFLGVELPFTLINLLLNSVPIVISFLFIGKKFTLFSCVTIVLSSVLTDTLPGYPLTNDPLLISVFGGIINALGISLCLFAEATSGGTDFIAIFMAERYNRDVWNFIFAGNVVILMTAGLLFGWDKALYSIIFQFTSTQVLSTVYKRYQKRTYSSSNIITNPCTKKTWKTPTTGPRSSAARAYMSKRSAPWCIPWYRRTKSSACSPACARLIPTPSSIASRPIRSPAAFTASPTISAAARFLPVRAPFAEANGGVYARFGRVSGDCQ